MTYDVEQTKGEAQVEKFLQNTIPNFLLRGSGKIALLIPLNLATEAFVIVRLPATNLETKRPVYEDEEWS